MEKSRKRWFWAVLAVTVGCLIPMRTMKASEDAPSVSGNSSVREAPQTSTIEIYEKNGHVDLTGAMGDPVSYDQYIGAAGGIMITVSDLTDIYYYLWKDAEGSILEENMDALAWERLNDAREISFAADGSADGKYVVCVKGVQDGRTVYAVSKGIVADMTAPKLVYADSGAELQHGDVCQTGTAFRVIDANLESVTMNEQPAEIQEEYQMAANGANCLIRAKDKAGNQTERSITILDTQEPTPDPAPGPDEQATVIEESREYSLEEGTAYTLGSGMWTVAGDDSVYPGEVTFYVPSGNYTFQRLPEEE